MLIKCWKVTEKYGKEAMIPAQKNPSNAKLGDKVGFNILAREGDARPLAINVFTRGHAEDVEIIEGGVTPTECDDSDEIKRQVLYYLSDENLRYDTFFHNIITSTEGGWVAIGHILGCKKMKNLAATTESTLAALAGQQTLEVRSTPAGKEAVRRKRPPPTLEAKGKGKTKDGKTKDGKGKGKGKVAALTEESAVPAPTGEVLASSHTEESEGPIYYAGRVCNQMQRPPHRFFIKCDTFTKSHGRDAWFSPEDKPANVEVGSLVVFSVPRESEGSPHASFVGLLAPLGSLGEAGDVPETASSGPAVQRAITKPTSKGVVLKAAPGQKPSRSR